MEQSEDQTTNDTNVAGDQVDELSLLKQRARMMGLVFSNNIGLDALKLKISKKQEGEADEPETDAESVSSLVQAKVNPLETFETKTPEGKKLTLRQVMVNEQMKLIRLRITNMDPKKKDLHGEIFVVANRYLGTVRKFIPYGEVTDDGFHVPYCLYQDLDARKFLNIRTTKDRRTGKINVTSSWAKEFALEILPPLTQAELNRLATAQTAAGSVDGAAA